MTDKLNSKRMQRVTGKPFTCACICGCAHKGMAGDGAEVFYADLSGTPFVAYYTERCAKACALRGEVLEVIEA